MSDGLMGLPLGATLYPTSFIAKILARMKAEIKGDEITAKHAINYKRVGMIKAYLLKQTKYLEEDITMALNKDFSEPAYLLGRLFATYEKIQEDDKSNVTIKYEENLARIG